MGILFFFFLLFFIKFPPLDKKDGIKPLPSYGPIYFNENLMPGIEYKYRVRGKNLIGWSPWTDPSEPMLTLSSIPDTPLAPAGMVRF